MISTAHPEATPPREQAPSHEHKGNQSSDNICIKKESLDLHFNDLSNNGESRVTATLAQRDTQGKDPLIQKFRILIISLVCT